MFNHVQAKNEIRKLFFARFLNFVQNGIPSQDPVFPPLGLTKFGSDEVYVPIVKWERVERRDRPDNGVHWLHFALQNVSKKQKTFAGGRKDSVGTQYDTDGFVTVELYFSKLAYQTLDADRLSEIVERCFTQQNAGSVWFRNTVVVDLEPEENHYRSNVLAEYQYDSVVT